MITVAFHFLLWRRAYTRNVRLCYPYRQYTFFYFDLYLNTTAQHSIVVFALFCSQGRFCKIASSFHLIIYGYILGLNLHYFYISSHHRATFYLLFNFGEFPHVSVWIPHMKTLLLYELKSQNMRRWMGMSHTRSGETKLSNRSCTYKFTVVLIVLDNCKFA